jgi:hypothetical protein
MVFGFKLVLPDWIPVRQGYQNGRVEGTRPCDGIHCWISEFRPCEWIQHIHFYLIDIHHYKATIIKPIYSMGINYYEDLSGLI